MPGSVAQTTSSKTWDDISQIDDEELRELTEQIFRLYDDSKFAEYGSVFVWMVESLVLSFALTAIPLNNFVRDGLIIAAAFGAIWPAYRYCQWRKWQIGKKLDQILASNPRGPEADRLACDLYHQNHPFC